MAKRKLKPWHYQVTTVLASITLFVVFLFFAQTFRGFFLTDHDPVLVAVERIKDMKKEAEAQGQTGRPEQTDR